MTYLVVAVNKDTSFIMHNSLEDGLIDILFLQKNMFNRILVDGGGSPVAIITTEKVDAHVVER